MGFRDLVLFYVVTGISLRWIATAAAAGPSSIVIWIGAWLVFYIPLAFSVVVLSSRHPDVCVGLLDQQSSILPCRPLFRREQCDLHAAGRMGASVE